MVTTTLKQLTLANPKAPRLASATPAYDPQYVDALNNILRLYFNQLDNFNQALISGDGGQYLSAPYGAFQDLTSQTATANTATLMQFGQTDFANRISLDSNSFRVAVSGIYNLQWSAQFQNTDNASHDISVWLRQGSGSGAAVDIPGSTGVIGMPPRKNPGDYFHSIVGWNYFLSMAADDYVEIYWSTDTTFASITTYAAGVAPVRPSTASIVATMSFVSALPVG